MTALASLLDTYRQAAATEREKGTYFEDLIICYLRNEATYRDLYSDVWTYAAWAESRGLDKRDTGIDLVAKTRGTDEFHAIQCKLYAADYKLRKDDIDSFFTASGKKPFTHRIIVSTTNQWTEHAENALQDQQPPVSKIDLHDLENSQIDWAKYQPKAPAPLKPKKTLRDHQQTALTATLAGFREADRGKLIMACGTGKTFTSLKIAEAQAGRGKRVLFLVPSLALLSQTLTEWTQESATPLHSFAVCSDSDVGKKKSDDEVKITTTELRYPATTEPARLATEMHKRHDADHMSVVFSTYHSIDVIAQAQAKHGLPDFDLIVCDEAHRTTGAVFEGQDESAFVRVHDQAYLRAAKRLYMTATPRIYGNAAKATAEKENALLYSMDDVAWFGREFHVITFSEAVRRGLLVDYKVIVLSVDEAHVSRRLQDLLADEDNQLKVDDAAKIVGCWKALAKQGLTDELNGDADPMKRAVAFCQVIEPSTKARIHKVSSKNIAGIFEKVVKTYQDKENLEPAARLTCRAEHVDGGMNASQKEEKIDWLKAEMPEGICRVLSNVRCLSEGVDVPALDAVLFLTPRNSQIDVVQSVGRVMRNAPGKKRGYVILPVVIPAGKEPHEALNDNKTFAVVWQVLNALRSHDDRFDAMVNKLDLIGKDPSKMEVIAITDKIQPKASRTNSNSNPGKGAYAIGLQAKRPDKLEAQGDLPFEIGEIERAIYAKLVGKVGNRHHWEDWANDIAKIAQTHITRITTILENPANTTERQAFASFAADLRADLNDSLGDKDIIEMLAQHIITRPVFEALFDGYSFAEKNPISQAMQKVLDALDAHRLEKEADTLQGFYDSVKLRAADINNAAAKQKIIVELYNKFFSNAFPRVRDKLGIVYTPVEVVDFIIHSVAHLLQTEFGQSLGAEGVHILDPFTGTGTFITRLLQSELIAPEQLARKYRTEIHANEIMLLAYYIAAINIEAAYHGLAGGEYVPFEGICLTDTFENHGKTDLVNSLLATNNKRRKRQDKLDIRVIIGNPPYSEGQKSENDNNDNVEYPALDERIRSTYVKNSKAVLSKGLYNSYIRAVRWASDRIGQSGIVGFICGSGFAEKPAMDGLRKCLAEEFSSIHIVNLRGDIRKNMLSKGRAKEGQNIFGGDSMTGIAIAFLVKNPGAAQFGQVHYHDIGDDLTTDEKKQKLAVFADVAGIAAAHGWQHVTPDAHGDWLNQRDDSFADYLPLGDKKGDSIKIFDNFSLGVVTNRDSWCYNASKTSAAQNMTRMIAFYNSEVTRYQSACAGKAKADYPPVDSFVSNDATRISWTVNLKQELAKGRQYAFEENCLTPSLYRPFTKQWLYFNRRLNERVYQMPRIFPDAAAENLVICVSGIGARSGFSALMANTLPNLHTLDTGQCFPLYLYDGEAEDDEAEATPQTTDLFAAPQPQAQGRQRREAITDAGLAHFCAAYPAETISKEDLFYYVYGLLHAPDYREKYADNLAKEMPRIPCVKAAADFWAFSKAGRALAELHLNYETAPLYPLKIDTGTRKLTDADYRVEKMRYAKKGKDKDLTTLIYNDQITLRGIPLEAYDYIMNGKPALDWVVERQRVKEDPDSGIVNDANDWAIETMHNPRYPLELVQRVITVSLETLKIVKALPPMVID
ncbi:MAG: DEAD/DEAH box helicase [Betaproteobacteria bacterium]|nr:DEAD/DEAH box helicase [Betaproteobacteria bacterium]